MNFQLLGFLVAAYHQSARLTLGTTMSETLKLSLIQDQSNFGTNPRVVRLLNQALQVKKKVVKKLN